MILYILLILGQAFASQDMALKAAQCTRQSLEILKGRNIAKSVRLETIAKSCIENLGYKDKLTISDTSVSGNMHRVKYNWSKGQYLDDFYSVNNSPCVDATSQSNGRHNSILINLNEIINNHENSEDFNSCPTAKLERDEKNNRNVHVHKQNLGFRRANNNCKRICPDNKIFRATKLPTFYTTDGKNNYMSAYSPEHAEIFLKTECISCAQLPSKNGKVYNLTSAKDNQCYDSDGCPRGTEYVKNMPPENAGRPSITEPNKTCYQNCLEGQTRGDDGLCKTRGDLCNIYKERIKKIESWKTQFMLTVNETPLGTCDITTIKKFANYYADEMILDQKKYETDCKRENHQLDSTPGDTFAVYLKKHYPSIVQCLPNPKTSVVKIDYNFYNLLTLDILSEESAYRY